MMIRFLCYLLVVVPAILCGCATHQQSGTFKEKSKIKTYTYEEALDLAEDSEGFYNFFLLPDISPVQAYAFEQKLATEWGTGYNVFTGAHPYTVMSIFAADIPVETLETYVEVLVAHLQAKTKPTKFSTFRSAIGYYVKLRESISSTFPNKADAEKALLGLLLVLEDDAVRDVDTEIQYVRRILDRVKLQHYNATKPDKSE